MQKSVAVCVVVAIVWMGIMPSFAQTPTTPPSLTPTPTNTRTGATASEDESDLRGHRVSFPFALTGNELVDCANGYTPAGTTLQGVGKPVDGNQLFVIRCKQCFVDASTACTKEVLDCGGTPLCEEDTCREGVRVIISSKTIERYEPDTFGLAYGALVAPFKFQLTGKQEFQGAASLGPYVGYRFDRRGWLGYSLTAAAFAGIGNVSDTETTTKTAEDGTTSTDTDTRNLAAFSYGVGLLGVINGGFQVGAVLGFDHADKGYRYNDRPWVALQIGYEFAQ